MPDAYLVALRTWLPSQWTVGNAAVQITPTPLGKRKSLTLKASCPGQTIYLGADSTVSPTTGYPLADRETLSLDIGEVPQIWAIASAPGQTLCVAEVGDDVGLSS